jgi:hypothetical protein
MAWAMPPVPIKQHAARAVLESHDKFITHSFQRRVIVVIGRMLNLHDDNRSREKTQGDSYSMPKRKNHDPFVGVW